MATTIVTKSGSGAPTASDLVAGELAVDLTNKRLYTEDSGGTVLEVGSNPYNFTANHDGSAKLATTATGIDVTGSVTADTYNIGALGSLGSVATDRLFIATADGLGIQFDKDNNRIVPIGADGSTYNNNVSLGSSGLEFKNLALSGTATMDGLTVSNVDGSIVKLESTGTGLGAGAVIGDLQFYGNDASTPGAGIKASITATTVAALGDDSQLMFSTSNGTTNNVNRMLIANNGDISFYEDTGTTGKLFWDASAESLGIGTSSPSYALHVYETPANGAYSATTNMTPTARFHAAESTTGAYTAIQLSANNANSALGWWSIGTVSTSTNYDNHLVFQTRTGASTYAERMRIDSSGNVGIGTGATVNRALEIAGNNNGGVKANYIRITDTDTSATADNQAGGIEFFTNDVTAGIAASMEVLYAGSGGGGEITFNTAANSSAGVVEAMRIDENGNVGIGTTSPASQDASANNLVISDTAGNGGLTINTPTNAIGAIHFSDGTSGADRYRGIISYGHSDNSMRFHTNTARAMTIDSSGNLLVGTATASISATNNTGAVIVPNGASQFSRDGGHTLDINRVQDGEIVRFRSAGNIEGSISISGSTTSYNTSSDQRLKNNIVDAPSASDDIDAIQVRSFDWKSDGSHQKYGMVAQELLTVAPSAVAQPENSEDMMGVDYSVLVPMMLKEIQSLRARVAQLES